MKIRLKIYVWIILGIINEGGEEMKKMSSIIDKYESGKKTAPDNVWDLWLSYSPNFKYSRAGLVASSFKCGWTFHKTWHSSWLEHALKSLCSRNTLLSESQDYLCETSLPDGRFLAIYWSSRIFAYQVQNWFQLRRIAS